MLNRFNFQICLRLSPTLPNKLGINILAVYLIYIYDTKNEYFSKFFQMIKHFSAARQMIRKNIYCFSEVCMYRFFRISIY